MKKIALNKKNQPTSGKIIKDYNRYLDIVILEGSVIIKIEGLGGVHLLPPITNSHVKWDYDDYTNIEFFASSETAVLKYKFFC